MIRLFEQHTVRQVSELDGMWDVTVLEAGGRKIPGQKDITGKTYRMPVPGVLEQHPDFMIFRGKTAFSR